MPDEACSLCKDKGLYPFCQGCGRDGGQDADDAWAEAGSPGYDGEAATAPQWNALALDQRLAVLAARGKFEHVTLDGQSHAVDAIIATADVMVPDGLGDDEDAVLCSCPLELVMARLGGQTPALLCLCGGVDPELVECLAHGVQDCPHGDPLHYHHDGCPSCA